MFAAKLSQFFACKMHRHCPIITAVSGILILILFVLCTWYIFPTLVHHEVHRQIALKPGTKAFEVWKKQPFPLLFKVYIFNVTNPGDVMVGEKPILKEMGPYIYSIDVERTNAEINEKDDTIKYFLKKTFHFDKKLSGCRTEEDTVTILNAALMGMVLQIQIMMPSEVSMVRDAAPYIYPGIKDMFLRTTVGALLFEGITLHCTSPDIDLLCDSMKAFLPQTLKVADNDKDFIFSMFGFMNSTPIGPYVMERGMKPNSTRGELTSYMDEPELEVWGDGGCNMINGSDSGMYFTMKKPADKIYTFTADICRSIFVTYDNPVSFEGISAFKYSTKKESLSLTSESECFCPLNDDDEYDCPLDGLVDLSTCLKAPVLLSFPHFLYADRSLQDFTIGLNPNKELHQSFLIIEPMTATPLTGAKRVQMSMVFKRVEDFPLLSNVSEGVFPLVWIDEFVAIPDDFIAFIKSNFKKLGLLDALKWIFILTGIGLLLISAVLFMYQTKLMCFANRKVAASTEPLQVRSGTGLFKENFNTSVKHPSLYPQTENKNVNRNVSTTQNQPEISQVNL